MVFEISTLKVLMATATPQQFFKSHMRCLQSFIKLFKILLNLSPSRTDEGTDMGNSTRLDILNIIPTTLKCCENKKI